MRTVSRVPFSRRRLLRNAGHVLELTWNEPLPPPVRRSGWLLIRPSTTILSVISPFSCCAQLGRRHLFFFFRTSTRRHPRLQPIYTKKKKTRKRKHFIKQGDNKTDTRPARLWTRVEKTLDKTSSEKKSVVWLLHLLLRRQRERGSTARLFFFFFFLFLFSNVEAVFVFMTDRPPSGDLRDHFFLFISHSLKKKEKKNSRSWLFYVQQGQTRPHSIHPAWHAGSRHIWCVYLLLLFRPVL